MTNTIESINALIDAFDDGDCMIYALARDLLMTHDCSNYRELATYRAELAEELAELDLAESPITLKLRELLDSLNRDELTEIRLQFSLCPLHAIDYAICFDDENADCAAIRTIHPSHDS